MNDQYYYEGRIVEIIAFAETDLRSGLTALEWQPNSLMK